MPDPNTEHGLRVQLATALRETERLRDALGDAFGDRRAADRRADAAEAALADARKECEGLRKEPQRVLAAELLAEFEKAYAETESQMTDSDRLVARRFIDVVAALAAPAAGDSK